MTADEEILQMSKDIETLIKDYPLENRATVTLQLSELKSDHVMARSEWNLLNARRVILILAQGNLKEISNLVEAAKKDFRDVIYWEHLERKKKK